MANLNELNGYQGNAALGAGTSGNMTQFGNGEFKFDAVDRFTALQVQESRDKWMQKNIEMQQASQKAQKDLNLKYGDLLPPDKTLIDEKVKEWFKFYNDNPDAVMYKVNPDGTNNAAQHSKYTQLKADIDFLIGRGNLRATQNRAVEDDIAKTADPTQQEQYRAFHQKQLTETGIDKNLILMPKLNQYDMSKAFTGAAAEAQNTFGAVKILDNNNVESTNVLTDPTRSFGLVANRYYNDQTNEGNYFRQSVDEATANWSKILSAQNPDGTFKYKDKDGNIDVSKLKQDEAGKTILSMVNGWNDYIGRINSNYAFSNTGTKVPVWERMGFTGPLEDQNINVKDGVSADEVMKMFLAQKLTNTNTEKLQATGHAITRENNQLDYRLGMNQIEAQKEIAANKPAAAAATAELESIADTKNNLWLNTLYPDQNNNGTPLDTATLSPEWAKDLMKGTGGLFRSPNLPNGQLYEVGISPLLQNALALPTETSKKTTGNKDFLQDETTVTSKTINPTRVIVQTNDQDRNKSKVWVEYEGGKRVPYSPQSFYNQLDRIYGTKEDVQMKVGRASKMFNERLGITNADAKAYADYYFNNKRPQSAGASTPTTDVYYSEADLIKKYGEKNFKQAVKNKIFTKGSNGYIYNGK